MGIPLFPIKNAEDRFRYKMQLERWDRQYPYCAFVAAKKGSAHTPRLFLELWRARAKRVGVPFAAHAMLWQGVPLDVALLVLGRK